ncbi:class I SAM-dependent methyltransferase [Thermococcus barophilus]|uniref:2-polyprenyl-3-methyl-5-hydroxy-6-metoxy-1, 4-benzoquinol methylase n=1 Tax=Thermococcus barophilus TaxID=55802 RepID=A0A0S1XF38_THEBA|nr:class I SAM-dependent methyltransferase [Thermococcus barophilus]ALM76396.1 2-polyprenyl-3-methyl-5-hydroxy-6-metoxy-1,4-benzoquinol methylase [Thermococcus barophilus]
MNFKHKLPKVKLVDREKFILDRCREKVVLHLGAVDQYEKSVAVFHRKLMNVASDVVGVDIDREGIEKAKKLGIHNIIYGNVETLWDLDINKKFDIIVAGEILEHISNPGNFLHGIKRFFLPKTQMIITTPNAFSLHRFMIYWLLNTEYVHSEHTCYYSYATLKNLLERHGFNIEETYYYHLGRTFERLLYSLFPHLSTGLIFVVSLRYKT